MTENVTYPSSGVESVQGRRVAMEDTHTIVDDVGEAFPDLDLQAVFVNSQQQDSNDNRNGTTTNTTTTHNHSTTTNLNSTTTKNMNNSRNLVSYYGVYDGHGGTHAALLCQDLLYKNIINDPLFSQGDIEGAIRNGFTNTDKHILEVSLKEGWTSGTTVVLCIVVNNIIYIANAGDSEAVLAKKKPKTSISSSSNSNNNLASSGSEASTSDFEAVLLSHKHKPSDASEKERIKKAGGHVVFGRVMGSLAVARALGDRDFKYPFNKGEADFVSAEPFVAKHHLAPEDDFVIISCDGLWDKMSYQSAVDFVVKCREEGKSAVETASLLVKMSLERGSLDNVTAIVVFLADPARNRANTTLSGASNISDHQARIQEIEELDDETDVYEFLRREGERKKLARLQLQQQQEQEQAALAALTPKDINRLKRFKLPPEEKIVEQHQCVLQRKMIDKPGIMIVTHNFILFYSSRFGKKMTKKLCVNEIHYLDGLSSKISEGVKILTKDEKKFLFKWRNGEEAAFPRLLELKAQLEKNKPTTPFSDAPEDSRSDFLGSDDDDDETSSKGSGAVSDDGQTEKKDAPVPIPTSPSNGTQDKTRIIGNWSRFDE